MSVETGNLLIESVQDVATSSSKTEGYNISGSMGADAKVSPGSVGANQNNSKSDSQWVNSQTTLIGGTSGTGEVNISADKTTVRGAVVASATRNEGGTLTDNGTLNLTTDELTVEDIQDKNHSESEGFNVSTSGYSGTGSTTVGLTSNGHEREQTTFATLGGGSVKNRDGEDHNLDHTNRDLNNSQQITKDQQTAGLDATVTVDHRLASEEGRSSIAKDFVDTQQHAMEIGQAVEDVITTVQGVLDFFGNVNDYATTRGVLAQQAADAAQQEKLRGDDGAEGSEEGLQNLSDALTEAHGLEEGADVSLYDGSQLADDTLAIDSSAVNKTQVEGAYHQEGNGVYVNIDNTDMTNSTDTVTTLVHEQARHEMAQNGTSGALSREDQTALATNRGDRAGEVWEAYSGLAGQSTQGSSNQQDWNNANRNSASVQRGNQQMATINNNDLKARQLNRNEASMLDKARDKINDSDSSDADKQLQLERLDALACAAVQCAAGVSENDPLFGKLSALQAQGESIKATEGVDILATLGDLGVDSHTTREIKITADGFLPEPETKVIIEQQFEYGAVDEAQDMASASALGERAEKLTDALVKGAITSGSIIVEGAVSAVGESEHSTGFREHMMQETRESVDGVINYNPDVGQRVMNSFTESTHEEAPNYVLGVAGATIPAAKAGKAILKPVNATIDKIGEKILDKVANKSLPLDNKAGDLIRENLEREKKKPVSYDVDNEAGVDTLAAKRAQRVSEQKAYEDRIKDATAHTGDNKYVERDLYESHKREEVFLSEKPGDKSKKGALAEGVRRILKNIEVE